MNWGLWQDKRRMVFKIPVGKTSPEEARELLKKLREEYSGEIDWSSIIREERRLKIDKIKSKMNEK